MSVETSNTTSTALAGPLSALNAFFGGLMRMSRSYSDAIRWSQQIEDLNGLSDDQLAARGLTRSQIIRAVFENRV